jgi:uncharacterized protein
VSFPGEKPRTRLYVLAGLLSLAVLAGCARGYYHATSRLKGHLGSGHTSQALDEVNRLLKVKSEEDVPDRLTGDTLLYLLERASILQALGRYRLAARDLELCDKHLEVLSLTGTPTDSLARYLYSEEKTTYKSTSVEKVLVNILNMINYLALRDLSGAKVEARRLRVMEDFLKESKAASRLSGLGAYLAGFVFEMAGEPQVAMRFYADAHERGGVPGLEEVMRDLHVRAGVSDRRVRKLLEEAPRSRERAKTGGQLLVICARGSVPHKVPRHVPIGWALQNSARGPYLTVEERENAERLAASGILKFLVFPELQASTPSYTAVQARMGETPMALAPAMDLETLSFKEFEQVQGRFLAAALSRMVARAVASNALEKSSGKKNSGELLGFLFEGAMTLMDTPDTRSWVSLPAEFYLARQHVPAQTVQLTVLFQGPGGEHRVSRTVTVPDGGYEVVYVTERSSS